jgi:hypothetical protein
MKAWTDYPFESLGDEAYKEAPVREVTVISYDSNKYCKILVNGIHEEVKRGYLYPTAGRCGDVPCLTEKQLEGVTK